MSTGEVIRKFIICDEADCGEQRLIAFSETHERQDASRDGWTSDGDNDYCPECSPVRGVMDGVIEAVGKAFEEA